MTDIWDDLWKNKPTSQGIYFNQLKWEKKVKAEGDRLKEKAEKYDAVNWNAIRATLDEKIEAEQKLEAVKALILQWRDEVEEYPDTTAGHSATVAVGLCIVELEKILEDS